MDPSGSTDSVLVGGVGDVFVQREDPPTAFDLVRPALHGVDVLFGNCEGAYTDRPNPPRGSGLPSFTSSRMGDHLAADGFHVMSLANNHTVDAGEEGLEDTMVSLRRQGIAYCGAGANAAEARRPAVVTRGKTRVAFLSYCSYFPVVYLAGPNRPGIAAVRAHTAYSVPPGWYHAPGTEPDIFTAAYPEDMVALEQDIRTVRSEADIVVASFHWGESFRPVVLLDHERQIAHAAVDWGADMVLAHHHHIIRGVDIYKGKPIFHGLGHFVFDQPDLDTRPGVNQALVQQRKERYGDYAFFHRPDYPLLPFHPDARMTALALCRFKGREPVEVGLLPCYINPQGQPEPLALDSERGQMVTEYVRKIGEKESLSTRIDTDGGLTVGGFRALRVTVP